MHAGIAGAAIVARQGAKTWLALQSAACKPFLRQKTADWLLFLQNLLDNLVQRVHFPVYYWFQIKLNKMLSVILVVKI